MPQVSDPDHGPQPTPGGLLSPEVSYSLSLGQGTEEGQVTRSGLQIPCSSPLFCILGSFSQTRAMSHRQGRSHGPTQSPRPGTRVLGHQRVSHRTPHLLGVVYWPVPRPRGSWRHLRPHPWGAAITGATGGPPRTVNSPPLCFYFLQAGSTMDLKNGFPIKTGKHL